MIGEPEYDTKTTLPRVRQSRTRTARIPKHVRHRRSQRSAKRFPRTRSAEKRRFVFVSVRRATPTKEQMALIRAHLGAGKPLVGIRTASHAFDAKPPDDQSRRLDQFRSRSPGRQLSESLRQRPARRNQSHSRRRAKSNPRRRRARLPFKHAFAPLQISKHVSHRDRRC
jgi:hypothetical protein